MSILVVDIGSTWMKAGLFEDPNLNSNCQQLNLLYQWNTATSRENLLDGFCKVLNTAEAHGFSWKDNPDKIVISSSAKGGLSIVALGIVPDLTLKAAKMAALSAGGKVVAHFAYELTLEDLDQINKLNPDIILFAGGTDGGNTRIIEHNALVLQGLTITPAILFAGNRTAWPLVASKLSHVPLYKAENLLPELSRTEPDSARAAIRSIFLETILSGKGLDQIQKLTSYPILPTPQVVFEYLCGIHTSSIPIQSGDQDFCLIDIGGATTDVYSVIRQMEPTTGVIIKGINEENVTRTVEGDLGMRISAPGVLDILMDLIISPQGNTSSIQNLVFTIPNWNDPPTQKAILDYISGLPNHTNWIAQDQWQIETDKVLAKIAILTGLTRHAGRCRQCYTPQGPVWIQEGKDIRSCKRVILTGGITSLFKSSVHPHKDLAFHNFDYNTFLSRNKRDSSHDQTLVLLPSTWQLSIDDQYLLPLLANGSRLYPEPARNTFITKFLEASTWN
jgi:uncharacterized protein (TIGR01319 family)